MYSYKCKHLDIVAFVLSFATWHWNGYGSRGFVFERVCFRTSTRTTACFVVSGGFLVCVGIVCWSRAVMHFLHFDSCALLIVVICWSLAAYGC